MVPYRDYMGGQFIVSIFDLLQAGPKEGWMLRGVKQALPESIALPAGFGPSLPKA